MRKNENNPVFTLSDPHGTTQLTYAAFSSSTTPVIERRAFDPYGNPLGADEPEPWIDDRTFLNKPENPVTDLVDMGARSYDPATGRFTSVDPLLNPADPTQANGYNYANNNPVTYSDPTGLYPVCNGEPCVDSERDPKTGTWNMGKQPVQPKPVAGEVAGIQGKYPPVPKPAPRAPTYCTSTGVCGLVAGHGEQNSQPKYPNAVKEVALALCSWVPFIGAACDAYDMKRTAEEDGVFSWQFGAAIIGIAPFGDIAKGPKAIERMTDTGRAADNVARACRMNSFTRDTPVLMADGTMKAIKDVELGDEVVASDPVRGQSGPREVVDLLRHVGLKTMVAVKLDDGTVINATDSHPFWVDSRTAWVDAIDLGPGDTVVTADGDLAEVRSLAVHARRLMVYNLTVAGMHTFHVGQRAILVHNDGGIDLSGATEWRGVGSSRSAVPWTVAVQQTGFCSVRRTGSSATMRSMTRTALSSGEWI
ncbi:polymorphic toxin-type HINT domain-containing protein [Nocardioides sp. WV_118_6]